MLIGSKKIFGFRDIVLLTVVANFGVRWLPVAAALGPSSILFWLLGALMFFLPLAFIAAQLSKLYPEEGGLYAWARHALGEKHGFVVAWLFWVNNLFFYPAILIFLATNLAYFLGRPELANNHEYILIVVLVSFWAVVAISFLGLKANKLLTEYGGILGVIIPAVLLIILGFAVYFWRGYSVTPYSLKALLPGDNVLGSLANLSMIMFAMAGIEIIPTFSNSVKNPKYDLYFGLIVGAVAIFLLYTLGTMAMSFLMTPATIQKTSGLMAAFNLIGQQLHMPWFTRLMAFLLVFSELAAISIWLIAPIIMFFKCTPDGLLPHWFHKQNRYEAPANAIIFMGFLVTLIILATNMLPSVSNMYQVLVLMTTILYFIPYLYLVVIYRKSLAKTPGKGWIKKLLAWGLFVSVCLGIVFSFEPPAGMKLNGIIKYEIELFLGPLLFLFLGYWLYVGRKKYIVKASESEEC